MCVRHCLNKEWYKVAGARPRWIEPSVVGCKSAYNSVVEDMQSKRPVSAVSALVKRLQAKWLTITSRLQ